MPERDELRQRITAAIAAYCDEAHKFDFAADDPMVRLHEPTFSTDEIDAALECLLSTRVTMGAKVKQFETAFAEPFGHTHSIMVNSGSSANLLAVAALANPEAADALRPGDEVIVPALSWSTTVWPLIQMGLVPVVVDIDPATLNIDPNEIETAIGPRTRGVMIVHVYGNPCDMNAILKICDKHSLLLIEDCCEALGATFDDRPVGGFGRAGTFSFYFSHHMTTLEGGITIARDFKDAELMRILRAHGWLREVDDPAPWTNRFPAINPRFLFVNLGYNLRATELQAAMGLVQLPKLPDYVTTRRQNANWMADQPTEFDHLVTCQRETPGGKHSWFGFPLTLSEAAPFSVDEIMRALSEDGIETRPIICGNIARQPGLQLYDHRVHGDLQHASAVMDRGFSVGNHQHIDEAARAYIVERIGHYLASEAA